METRTVTTQLPESLVAKADKIAANMERSRSWIIKEALTDWLEIEERRKRLTLEALADIEAGNSVDHARVKEWVASLDSDNPLPMPE